jgi:hypothetical protein
MDKKSKILIIAILLLIAGSVAVTYFRIMVRKDYIISAQTDCDPLSENCFVWNCDPESKVEGESCTGNTEEDTWYYKIIKRKAANIPLCDPNDENCTALTCPEGEADCEEIFCTEDSRSDEDICTTPEQYILEHPEALEEETICEEGDEECEAEEACDPEIDENCDATEEECDPEMDENCDEATEETPTDASTSESDG